MKNTILKILLTAAVLIPLSATPTQAGKKKKNPTTAFANRHHQGLRFTRSATEQRHKLTRDENARVVTSRRAGALGTGRHSSRQAAT